MRTCAIQLHLMYVGTDMTDQLWVSVEVKRGSAALVLPTVLPATVEDTFGSLLNKVENNSADDSLELQAKTVERIAISGATASSGVHVVPLNAPVVMVSPCIV